MIRCILMPIAAIAALLASVPNAVSEERKDVLETAMEGGQFKTLVTAFKEAGMDEMLKGKGPFTIFAPTDEAFQKVSEDKLKSLLADREILKKMVTSHVVVGKDLRAADVAKMSGQTLNGFVIKAEADRVMVGKATVTKADITCANGVIHVIDVVLMPD
ncbi:MAG TPA: fasciclin domain-containing protein [Gemmataceae bacterium]|nr:fasciclin domain-containing protein [Gemmataceae bacterium]